MSGPGPSRRSGVTSVRFLWIDLGGVIVGDPRPTVVRRLKRRASRRPDRLEAAYYDLSRRLDTDAIPLRDAFDRLHRDFGLSIPYRSFRRLVCNESLSVHREVVRVLRQIHRSTGVWILFTSNVSRPVWRGLLRRFSLREIRDDAVLSFRVRALKPSRRFFRAAMRRTPGNLQHVLFLDDAPENIEAARRLGIRSHRVRSAEDTVRVLRRAFLAPSAYRRRERGGPLRSRMAVPGPAGDTPFHPRHLPRSTPRRLPAGAARSRS